MMRKNRRFIALGVMLAVLAAMVSGCSQQVSQNAQVWGQAEAKEVDVNSKIPGRVVELLVKEGDRVEKGQLLARIDNRDLVAKSNQAKAGIDALQAQLSQAGTVTKLEDQVAQANYATAVAQLEKAKADLALASKDYFRFQELRQAGAVSQQMLDNYRLKFEVAQANLEQAKSLLASAEAGMMKLNVNRENEEAVKSKIAQAQAALAEVGVYLDETEIRAPFSGIVTAKYVEQGAMVSTGTPLVAVQDPLDNWVNIKVKETDLAKYKLNQEVVLEGRDPSLKLKGVIVDISKKPEFATYRATNERGENDIITFNVKIRVNSENVRPGMRFRIVDGGK